MCFFQGNTSGKRQKFELGFSTSSISNVFEIFRILTRIKSKLVFHINAYSNPDSALSRNGIYAIMFGKSSRHAKPECCNLLLVIQWLENPIKLVESLLNAMFGISFVTCQSK